MPYFGKTPLTKNVSRFVQDFNTDLQQEMSLLYAPQNTQVNAVVTKMQEDAAYQQQKQQSVQRAMSSMIAADRGLNPADAEALARMMAPPPAPAPPQAPPMMAPPPPMSMMPPPPPRMAPPPPVPFVPPTVGRGGAFPAQRQFMPGGMESIGALPPPPPPMSVAGFMPQTDVAGMEPTPPLQPGLDIPIRPMGLPEIQYANYLFPRIPDVASWPGRAWEALPDVTSWPGQAADVLRGMIPNVSTQPARGGGVSDFEENLLFKPNAPYPAPYPIEGKAGPGITDIAPTPYQSELAEFQREFRNPDVSNVGRISLITRMMRGAFEADQEEGLNMLSGLLSQWLRNPTAEGGQPAPFDTNIISDVQPFLDQVKNFTVELQTPLETDDTKEIVIPPITEVKPVPPSDGEPTIYPIEDQGIEDTIAQSEAEQPAVNGQSYLDWLSAVDTGKEQIYKYFKDTDPQFRLMSPYAESVYGKAEAQMRHQYNLESLDSASQWYGRSRETPEAANQNYLDYLKAAFDPGVRTANLWSREQWSDKLGSIYKSAFADKGQTMTGNLAGPRTEVGDYTTGVLPSGLLEPSTTAELTASAFAEYASDPATVMEWIKAKSLKGANPIISFYGPAAVERSVNKWLIENTPSMDIGTEIGDPTDDPGGLGRGDIDRRVAMSLFEAWAKKDFQWFRTEGQAGQGYGQ